MKLKCIKDVVMSDGSVPFCGGLVYEFSINAAGEISGFYDNTMHMFRATGSDSWPVFFKRVEEDV